MRATPPKSVATPHTRAWLTFEQNLDSVSHLLALNHRELASIKAATVRISAFVTKAGASKQKAVEAVVAKVLRPLQRYAKTLATRVDRVGTVVLWEIVILVTCVEAYLQDVLSIAASVDPELMKESQQVAPYGDVISAVSLDELANALRARWARGWLSDGGPTRWISRLAKMGARGYPDDLAPRLELMWGIRHVAVHAAGVATKDFVKRHPGVVAAAGDRVRVNVIDLKAFLEAVRGFMMTTDEFFLARYPALLAAPSAAPST